MIQWFGISWLMASVFLLSCNSPEHGRGPSPLTIGLEQPPSTLNPRYALDAGGQRLGALIFRGLTRIDANLNAQPDLAEKFEIKQQGKLWEFKIRSGLLDHGGSLITPELIAKCLDEYRLGKPASPHTTAFPTWKATHFDSARSTVQIELGSASPYLARNISLLRYFRVIGQDQPCREGPGEWVGSGPFRPKKFELNPIADLSLLPFDPQLKPVKFLFVRDEMTRTLMLLHGEIDVLQNSLTLAKTRWIQTEHSDQFSVLERLGVNVAYLAFNQKNPFLRDINVRRAIAHAIPREDVVHYKMFGFGSIAGSFLSPSLPESLQLPFLYDPKLSEGLLDQAGYKRGPNGVRFRLRYRTTSLREGHEQVLIYSKSLEKIGIKIDVEMTEPAVFLASVRKGNFDLYSSRWVGVGDGSILYSTLFSTQPNNRAGYKNQKMDELLNSAMSEVDTQKRIKTLQIVQKMMLDEMTYFPLYYWANSVILKRELAPRVDPQKLSLSGALEPLIYQLQQ